jgi:hypothetical protein
VIVERDRGDQAPAHLEPDLEPPADLEPDLERPGPDLEPDLAPACLAVFDCFEGRPGVSSSSRGPAGSRVNNYAGGRGRCAGPGWGGPLCYRWVGGFGLLVCVALGVLVGPCPGSLRQFRLIAGQRSAVCVGWSCPPRPWGRRFSGTTRRPF